MSTAPHHASEQRDQLPKDMLELMDVISQLPSDQRRHVDPFLQRVVQSTKRRRRILSLVQEALSQLRLDMKYLVFDLEATRRERDEYRRSMEEE